jgi:hypothetical protein
VGQPPGDQPVAAVASDSSLSNSHTCNRERAGYRGDCGDCRPQQHDFPHEAIVVALLIGVMALNLLTLWNTETILRHGLAGVLPVIGWVLAVLQASLAVQIMIYSLRLLAVLPAS